MPREPNTGFIGPKPVISHALAVTMLFSADNKKVTLNGRGKAITTVINVEEMTRSRFTENFNAGKISLGTEQLPMQEEGTRAVSTIEITLATEAKPKKMWKQLNRLGTRLETSLVNRHIGERQKAS